jgi:hypothetical protein
MEREFTAMIIVQNIKKSIAVQSEVYLRPKMYARRCILASAG